MRKGFSIKSLITIFVLIFCLTSMPAFADDCADEIDCEYSLQNAKNTDSHKGVDVCACCDAHQIKTLGSAMVFSVQIVKDNIFSSRPERFYYNRATSPLLEPPAA
jgi:hypothetical protein